MADVTVEVIKTVRLVHETTLQDLQREFRELIAQMQAIGERIGQNRAAYQRALGAIAALDELTDGQRSPE